MDGGPVPALSKYALRDVTGICFLTRSIFKETPGVGRCHLAELSIKEVLDSVEALYARLRDAILAPEPVPLRAILCVAVCYYVSAVSTPNDEDFPHLMIRKLFLMSLYLVVAWV
jgi:hypothetical protein